MTKDEALRLALDALELCLDADTAGTTPRLVTEARAQRRIAIEACRAALSAPAAQPVAYYLPAEGEDDSMFRDARTVIACTGNKWHGWIPLYTAAPAAPADLTIHWPQVVAYPGGNGGLGAWVDISTGDGPEAITRFHAAPAAPEPVAYTVAGEVTNWARDFSKYRTQHYVRPVYAGAAPAAPSVHSESTRFADVSKFGAETNKSTAAPSVPAEPIGWLEAPHGKFRRNLFYKLTFPPQTLAWSVPVYLAATQPGAQTGKHG